MFKKTSVNLLDGPILRSIITFAIPILISNVFQQLYNTADIMIVGRYLGPNALAGVGATAAIFELVIGFALGVGNGMGVVIARCFGAQDMTQLKRAVASTLVIGLALSFLVSTIGHFGMYPLLGFLGTPTEIIDLSYQYIHMIVLCVGVTFAYNLCAGLLRAVGDSQAALYFLIFSAIVNIILDLFFITQLHLGVQSAGLATIISQGLSAILCYFYIRKRANFLLPKRKHFIWDKELYLDLLGQGLAMGLMTSIVSIGTVTLQTSINALGATIISAQTSARRIMSFSMLPVSAIASSLTTFTSQNLGANRPQRIQRGIYLGSMVAIVWTIFVTLTLFFASPALNELISGSTDPELISNASLYNRISSSFYPVLAVLLVLRNSLQGLGQKITPLISSFIELFGKILFVLFIIPSTGYMGVIFCEPLIWVPMTIQLYYSYKHQPIIQSLKNASYS